jgi:hypothetical protein
MAQHALGQLHVERLVHKLDTFTEPHCCCRAEGANGGRYQGARDLAVIRLEPSDEKPMRRIWRLPPVGAASFSLGPALFINGAINVARTP